MTTSKQNNKQFKKELKELLKKYNAVIRFSCSDSSDTHGLYEEKIIARVNNEEITLADGWGVNSRDL